MPELKDFVTTEEAARILRYHVEHVRRLLREGRLDGERAGSVWLVLRRSVEEYREQTAGLGKFDPRKGRGQAAPPVHRAASPARPAPGDFVRVRTTLQRIPQFHALSEKTRQALGASAVHRRFGAGQVIYVQGEPAESVYVLESGWVKATRMTRDGREQAMMFLRPVEVFGDIAVFTGTAYPGTVIALEPVSVWALSARTLLDLTRRQADLAMAVIRHLGERVLHYLNLVEDLSLRSVEARLAHTLLQNAELRDGQLVVPRREWTTFDEMAVRLGTVRDVLSRALKTLEVEGLLRVQRHAILLLDPKGLAERGDR